ncbi:MAG: transposase, partial [Acidaminococcaceae bacterium]|nr:transposase [Acidaminococcaceae bacterium]
LAAKGLEYCSRLFEVEQTLDSLPDADRRKQRQILSKPIVDEYYAWLGTIFRPAGKLKKAVTYSLNQREYLCAFLDHGEIEISNNQVENAIRLIVVGRKNWLFCDTQAGANASVIVFTVLETAKANGLNPEAYLNHLLSVLPERFADEPQAKMDDLMPWDEDMRSRFRA